MNGHVIRSLGDTDVIDSDLHFDEECTSDVMSNRSDDTCDGESIEFENVLDSPVILSMNEILRYKYI